MRALIASIEEPGTTRRRFSNGDDETTTRRWEARFVLDADEHRALG